MKARVFITLKNGVLDPQGKAIHHALEGLGFSGVNDVRAGKLIELDLADGTDDAAIEDMCRKLLANTVIENFRIERLEDAMNSAVIVFPGSNCDRDLAVALEQVTGRKPAMVWHRKPSCPTASTSSAFPAASPTAIICARARWRRARRSCARSSSAAGRGVPVIGICNGFQVLTEAGLLPGALMRNAALRFVCREVPLRVENSQSLFTANYDAGEEIAFPVAHHDGNYQADEATLDRLEGEGRVAFRYLDEVNGSARRIAGILNDSGNVLGLMPHPERVVEPAHGGTDGRRLFEGLLETVAHDAPISSSPASSLR